MAITMSSSLDPVFFEEPELRSFTEQVFRKTGVASEEAKIAADVLIEADLRGFDCHGLARLYPYFQRIKKGLIETRAQIEIKWLTPTTGCCDGGNGIGMIVGRYAMNACLQRAAEFGSAFLTVRRSNHFGIAGYFSSMALDSNMIGLAMCNASPRVVPTGGTTGVLGTNPISLAVPDEQGGALILDMSTSAVSSGKIDVALRKGEKIPAGWVYPSVEPFLDSEGVVPMSVLQYPLGGVKETGGYKGYGLALMVDILAGVLSGANFGTRLAASKKSNTEAGIGHFFGAWQVSGFRSMEEFSRDVVLLYQDVKSSPLEPAVERIFIPGEPELLKKKANQKEGIPILPATIRQLEKIAAELNIVFSPKKKK
jgi:LDH2 family malate/lactate/ureidoglycolate dehydrogenase